MRRQFQQDYAAVRVADGLLVGVVGDTGQEYEDEEAGRADMASGSASAETVTWFRAARTHDIEAPRGSLPD